MKNSSRCTDTSSKRREQTISKHVLHVDSKKRQPFQYYLVLDFEATCERDDKAFVNEIIEFPTVIINSETLENCGEFHQYVKPKLNPTLTAFCKELTGIQQEWIEDGKFLCEVMKDFHQWLTDNEFLLKDGTLNPNKTFLFVTCGGMICYLKPLTMNLK